MLYKALNWAVTGRLYHKAVEAVHRAGPRADVPRRGALGVGGQMNTDRQQWHPARSCSCKLHLMLKDVRSMLHKAVSFVLQLDYRH